VALWYKKHRSRLRRRRFAWWRPAAGTPHRPSSLGYGIGGALIAAACIGAVIWAACTMAGAHG